MQGTSGSQTGISKVSRETALKKIRKLYGSVLECRKENNLPMTLDEKYFLEKGNKKMIEDRNVTIITDVDGKKLVLINDIRFKGKRKIDWDDVKQYLKGYVGDYYKIEKSAERIFIGNELPEEYTESESRKSLMGANAKAKANAATAIPELIQIASNPAYEENRKEKHGKNAMHG